MTSWVSNLKMNRFKCCHQINENRTDRGYIIEVCCEEVDIVGRSTFRSFRSHLFQNCKSICKGRITWLQVEFRCIQKNLTTAESYRLSPATFAAWLFELTSPTLSTTGLKKLSGNPESKLAGVKLPGTGVQFPVAGPQLPGAGPQLPGAGPQLPGAGPQLPGAGPQLPGAGPQLPGSEQLSGAGPPLSEAGPLFPGSGPQLPGAGSLFSWSGPQFPGVGPQLSGAWLQLSAAGPQLARAGPQLAGAGPQLPGAGLQLSGGICSTSLGLLLPWLYSHDGTRLGIMSAKHGLRTFPPLSFLSLFTVPFGTDFGRIVYGDDGDMDLAFCWDDIKLKSWSIGSRLLVA